MKIVFFGTPDYVLPIIERLHETFKTRRGESPILAVVTQKPKPAGRKRLLLYSPVDTWAHKHDVRVLYNPVDLLTSGIKADIGILESYGEIIPKSVLGFFPYGVLNAHPSLLPKYRGASPVPGAIVSGEKETGVTIIKLDEKWDHGPAISQFKEKILETDTTGTLRARLFQRSADVLVELIEPYLAGKIKPRPQDDSLATFTTRTSKEDGFIPPKFIANAMKVESSLSTQADKEYVASMKINFVKNCMLPATSYTLHNFIRAMDPWPHAWTFVQPTANSQQPTAKKRLIILKSHVETVTSHQSPVTSHHLVLDEVQLEGKNPVSAKQFKEAYPKAEFS